MKTINKILISVLAVFVVMLTFGAGYCCNSLINDKYSDLEWALEMVDKHYYAIDPATGEPKAFTVDEYIDAITSGLLDPYSEYLNPTELAEYISLSEGNVYGIGARFSSLSDDLVLMDVAWNSPLDKACIKAGIEIVGKKVLAVADKGSSDKTEVSTFNEFSTALSKYDAHVEFDLYIEGVADALTVSREEFIEAYVKYYDNNSTYLFESENFGDEPTGRAVTGGKNDLPEDTAYIVFTEFNGSADIQFASAMDYLKSQNKSKLVLDMRNNGGGFMDILTEIASYLINNDGKDKSLVTSARYKDGREEGYYTDENNYVPLSKLTVIANEYSASATECLIGALLSYGDLKQENLIVTSTVPPVTGSQNTTYGKGIMQSTFTGNNNNAIKLTTAYIYWPDGETNIHGKGIKANAENSVIYADGYKKALEVSSK